MRKMLIASVGCLALAVPAMAQTVPAANKAELPKPFMGHHVWWTIRNNESCITHMDGIAISPEAFVHAVRNTGGITDTPQVTHNDNGGESYKDEIVSVEVDAQSDSGPGEAHFWTDYHLESGRVVTGKMQCELVLGMQKTMSGQSDSDNLN